MLDEDCSTGADKVMTTGLTETRSLLKSIYRLLSGRYAVSDIVNLLHVRGSFLAELLRVASSLRDEYFGNIITYSRKAFIPLTNICANACSYCNFRRTPQDADAVLMRIEDAVELVRKWEVKYNIKEVLVCTGERPDVYPEVRDKLNMWGFRDYIEYVYSFLERLIKRTSQVLPHVNIGYLSFEDAKLLRPYVASFGLMLECATVRLLNPGMPHASSPTKHPRLRVEFLYTCERLSVPVTTGILVGIGETVDEIARSIHVLSTLCRRLTCIQEIIVQNYMPGERSSRTCATCREVSLQEMLRLLAVTRIVIRDLTSIQAPPNLAPGTYSLYILAGINDWGGISPVTPDYVNPGYRWPSIRELREVTEDMGYILRERLPIYPKYVREYRRWVSDILRDRVLSLVDETNLVAPDRASTD